MNAPGHADPQPVTPPVTPSTRSGLDDADRRPAQSRVGSPSRILALCFGSIVVMAPWPLLGIMLTRPEFDRPSEAFLLFGGITLFPLMLLALFGSVPEAVLIGLIMLVWMVAAVLPGYWLRRRLTSWSAVVVLLSVQSAFSFAQAVMGALLVVGKSV